MVRAFKPDSAVALESEAQAATLPQRSRWVTASKQTSMKWCCDGKFRPITTKCQSQN